MLLIARRYLLSPKSHSVVNIICGVSLISMMVPVAAVIILLSVFNGFGEMISDMNRAVEGDLTVKSATGGSFSCDTLDTRLIAECRGVEAMSFVTEQMVLLREGTQSAVVTLRGVDEHYSDVIAIEDHVLWGAFELKAEDDNMLVIGGAIASKLGLKSLSDSEIEITTIKTSALQSIVPLWRYKSERVNISGVVAIDEQSDENIAYTSRRIMSRIGKADSTATKLIVKIAPRSDISAVQKELQRVIGDGFKVLRREQLDPTMYDIVRYEKLGISIICTLVMILASFSLLGAMTMLIIEKQKDIETLRAMGASMVDIKRVFIMEGGLISSIAIGMGVIIGVVVTLTQQYLGVIELPSQSMVINYYPVKLMLSDLLLIIVLAISIAAAMSWSVVNKMVNSKDFR